MQMEYILTARLSRSLGWPARALIGGLVALAVIVPLFSGFLRGQNAPGAPVSADTLFESGTASLKAGKFKEAEEAFGMVSKLEPANSRGSKALVEVYLAQKKYDEAIQLLRGEVEKDRTRLDYR